MYDASEQICQGNRLTAQAPGPGRGAQRQGLELELLRGISVATRVEFLIFQVPECMHRRADVINGFHQVQFRIHFLDMIETVEVVQAALVVMVDDLTEGFALLEAGVQAKRGEKQAE